MVLWSLIWLNSNRFVSSAPSEGFPFANLSQFSYDKSTGYATIGGGTLLNDVTKRLHKAGGRAMAHGLCPQVKWCF